MTRTAAPDRCYLVHPDTRLAYRARVVVSRRGLTVVRTNEHAPRGRASRSEIRVPWWALEGFSADGSARGPDGQQLQSVEIGTAAGTLFVVAPAAEVSQLFARLSEHKARWRRWRSPAMGALGRSVVVAGTKTARIRRPLSSALGPFGRRLGKVAVPPALLVIDVARLAGMAVLALAGGVRAVAGFVARILRRTAQPPIRTTLGGLSALDVVARMAVGPVISPFVAVGRLIAGSPPGRVAGAVLARVGAVLAPPLQLLVTRLKPAARVVGWPLASTGRRRVTAFTAGLASLALLVGAAGVVFGGSNPSRLGRSAHVALTHRGEGGSATLGMSRLLGLEMGGRSKHKAVELPAATAPPAPAPPSLANQPPLQPHEVFAFAPYWTLPQGGAFNVSGMTTLAYFSIAVNADGSLNEGGAGWNGYESQALADLVTRAHGAGDRVVLTVNCFDQGTLNQLTSSPTAAATLSQALIAAIAAKNLDGVNIDFEGQGSGDQNGLTNLISTVSTALHAANPHWQVTMDTYASSAGDPAGFYNIAALAPWVDGFFVMAYQLNYSSTTVPTSPLTSSMFSDVTTVQQYAADVPASKVILGLPYYGLDWPTTDGTLNATATGGSSPVSYSQIVASGHPIYWDSTTDSGWTSYQVGNQWHETFFEVPSSLYMDAQLAQNYGFDGVGIWALGMDGNDPAMLAAIDGLSSVEKPGSAGPTSTTQSPTTAPTTTTTTTTTTTSPGTGTTTTTAPSGTGSTTTTAPPTYSQSGQYLAQTVTLTKLTTSNEVNGISSLVGQLSDFSTSDPSLTCLEDETALNVYQYEQQPNEYVVVAATPTDCTDAEFSFPIPADPTGNGSSTDSGTVAASGADAGTTSTTTPTTAPTATSMSGLTGPGAGVGTVTRESQSSEPQPASAGPAR